jgi:hypothetical protein
LHHDGWTGLIRSVEEHSVHGPLVPLVTVPLEVVFGTRVANGFVVIAGFYGFLVGATYLLARRVLDPWFAALTALVVGTAPEVLTLARAYYFAVPAAALFTASAVCFLRSDGLRRFGWVVAGGAFLGLTVLSRTMMLALAAGPPFAVLVQGLARGGDVRRRLLALAAGLGTATAIAATWYARNIGDAVGFLIGTRFREPSAQHGLQFHLSGTDVRGFVATLQLPLMLLLVGITVAVSVGVVGRLRHRPQSESRRQLARRVLQTDIAVLVLIVAEGVLAFVPTDEPVGKWLPLLPAVVTLAVVALRDLPRVNVRRVLVTVTAGFALFNLVMMSDVWPVLGEPRTVEAGPIGSLTVTDGRQFVQRFLGSAAESDRPGRFPGSWHHLLSLHHQLTDWMTSYATQHRQRPVVVTAGNESRSLNLNDLLLVDRLRNDDEVLIAGRIFVEADTPRHTIGRRLDDPEFGLPNLVLTYENRRDERKRATNSRQPVAEQMLAEKRFQMMRIVQLPDGTARIWWRSQANVPTSRSRRATTHVGLI